MGLLPRAIQGATHGSITITWTLEEDGSPDNLTGATISAAIKDDKNGVTRAATGTFALVDAENGQFSWSYSAEDVATPGCYAVQFKANFGSDFSLTFPEPWIIEVQF